MTVYAKANRFYMNLRPLKASRFWNAKQGTFPREVSCKVETQPRFLLEDKGKVPLSVGSVAHTTSIQGAQSPLSREAELEPRGCESSLALPNQRELISNTKSTPLSWVKELSPSADSVAYAALAPRILIKSLTARLELKHYAVLITFAAVQRSKPLRAKSEDTKASLPMLSSTKLTLGRGELKV